MINIITKLIKIPIYHPNTHPLSVTQGQLSSTQFGLVSFSERDLLLNYFSYICRKIRITYFS